ncbi:MAG TPA: hypothetical protein VFN03_06305, partial [Trueperaceae bacterium]|nr:hypothetical protein [Trueperaceae bacterium]
YTQGESLTLTGRGLQPSAEYTLTLTPPPETGAAPRQVEARSSSLGNLSRRELLDLPGVWTVELVGPEMNAQLRITVNPDPNAAPAAPQQEQDAPEPTPTPAPAPGNGLPQPNTPVPTSPPTATSVPSASIREGDLVGVLDGRDVWGLTFGPDSGGTSGLLQLDGRVLVGHGNHVLVVDASTGVVARRYRMPARVAAIEQSVGTIEVVIIHDDGSAERLPFSPDQDGPLYAFDPTPDLYGWLRAEAQVTDPNAALAEDPTNPWLYVAAAQLSDSTRAEVLRRGALSRAQTFYEYAQLANEFMLPAHRNTELASQAMEAALEDFTRRGYRATMLYETDASALYGFPLSSLRTALDRSDTEAADFWAPWVYRMASPDVPASAAVMADHASQLRAAGRQEEARVWTERAGEGRRFTIQTTLRRAAESVGRTGWYGVGALLVAILALHLTLTAKYWRAQTLVLTQRRQAGAGVGPAARLFTLRYATITEKLVIILLFAAVLAQAALNGWVQRADEMPARLGTGTLATVSAQQVLRDQFPASAGSSFALAYAAQLAGDLDTATVRYRDLTDDADAMNNLGVIRNDPELFRLALELEPGHPEASANLGLGENPSRLLATYLPDQPVLATPDRERLTVAWAGDYGSSLSAAFTNPWASLTNLRALQPQWLWIGLVILFLAWVAFTVITLLIPRPAAARNSQRTFLYHLLALLLPGSGLADELWGVLLLVPWAIFGIDFLQHYFILSDAGASFTLQTDTIVLIVIYVINTLAFIVEYLSYRRRMRALRP